MKPIALATKVALTLGVSTTALSAEIVPPTNPPAAPVFEAQGVPNFVNRSDIYDFRALDSYSEPGYVAEFVARGKLPPVAERLPKEPLVYKEAFMPEGIGTYGDVMRHVIGGRPEGWNFWGGQAQGWGGITIALTECLTRTGPLFTVNPEDLEPLPNLAKSWEWSDDGMSLTVNLIEGARWSDGDPFDTEDIAFYWNDIIMDPNLTPLMGATQDTYGAGTTLEIIDDYSFRMNFTAPFRESVLYAMAYGNFCPGPSHVLKPHHPNHGGESYEAFKTAFPTDYMNFPVMGAWVPVEHRADDIVIMRRNPYYWKVDEAGNQLPYLDEMHFRLSTWADRTVQTVAGTGDFSNLEQPTNFVEALRAAAQPDAPAKLEFGARIRGHQLQFNYASPDWGNPDDRQKAVRELNRNRDFRIGVTQALDRARLGDSLVKGPFTAPYAGGLFEGTSYYDAESTVFYPYSVESAKAHFEAAGLADTDGNGFYNFPGGGEDVQIALTYSVDYETDKTLAEGVAAMMAEAGLRVVLNGLSNNDSDDRWFGGTFEWAIRGVGSEVITVVQNTQQLAPTGPRIAPNHMAESAETQRLMPFEQELVEIVNAFIASRDAEERTELMKRFQKVYTENVYAAGLSAYPGALIINKRFSNVPAGTPIFMYNWAEDNIMRERLFVAADAQADHEVYPNTLPGAPGSPGPISLD